MRGPRRPSAAYPDHPAGELDPAELARLRAALEAYGPRLIDRLTRTQNPDLVLGPPTSPA